MEQLVVISGATKAGKSTAALMANKIIKGTIVYTEDHKKNFLYPAYMNENECSSYLEAEDWIRYKDHAGYAKMLFDDIDFSGKNIIDSILAKEDLEYIMQINPSTKLVYVHSNFTTRLDRSLKAGYSDEDYTKARKTLQYEWDHLKLSEAKDFMKEKGAFFVDTSNLYHEIPDSLMNLADFLQ